MFRRSALLLCGVVVGASALSGVAYAAPDDGTDRGAGRGDARGDARGTDHGADYVADRGDDRGRAELARCEGAGAAHRDRREDGGERRADRGDRREGTSRSARPAEGDDSDEPDGSDGSDEAATIPVSCGGRGGAPGLNSSDCGSSLLPAGVSLAPCAAPPARRGQDG